MNFNNINILGLFSYNGGITAATRNLLKILDVLNIKYNTIDVQSDFWRRLKYNSNATLNIWCLNPDWGRIYEQHIRRVKGYNVGFLFWELTSVPGSWHKPLQYLNEIWTYSQMSRRALSVHNYVPVFCITPHIEVNVDPNIKRADFGIPEKKFMFLCMYDALSVRHRKNPIGVIEAFKGAFIGDDSRVGLIVKSSNERDLSSLQNIASGYNNIYFINRILPTNTVHGIINFSDCIVSLHRAEGFGLVLAEAMYLGKPVICTNWSGNTDFTYPGNSLLVDYNLSSILNSQGPFKPGGVWAEPNITTASRCMMQIYTDQELREDISKRGMDTIKSKYSLQNSSSSIASRLERISTVMRESNFIALGRKYISRQNNNLRSNIKLLNRKKRREIRLK